MFVTENASEAGALIRNGTADVDQTPWIAATVADALCFLLSLWIFVCLLWYGLWRRKFSNRTRSARVLYFAASAAAGLTTVYLAVKTTFDLRWRSDIVCDRLSEIAVELYVICTSAVYLFLWFKQRSLYQKRMLSHLYRGWAVVVSYMSIVFMVVGLNAAAIVFNIINEYGASAYGCKHRNTFLKWPFLVGSAINASGQGMMLLLFLYPFRCAKSKPKTGTGLRLLKRSLAITLLCITTDAVTGLVNAFVPYEVYRTPFVAYATSATFNLVGVLLTFETWRDMLISPVRRPRMRFHRRTVVSRSNTMD